jgi:predicted transcriptional regulator
MSDINVQTTLPEAAYEALARVARVAKRPLKAVVREAIEEYVGRQTPAEKDPLLTFVGRGRLKETDWSQRKDWRA